MNQFKQVVIRLHAAFLQLYPAHYRAEFEDEIAETFAEMVADANSYMLLFTLCWREMRDWPTCMLREHWLWLQQSIARYITRQRSIQRSRPGMLPQEKIAIMSPAMAVLIERNPLVHRLFDLLFASFWLLLLSPLIPIIMVLIRLDSAGPVIYRQLRIGIDGQSYIIYKFRSMTAESGESKRDITRVGKILRKFSVDELPQLFNILKGEMSVIGPRPHMPK
ncbi:sugar transferase [Chloroflexi bacterium TSY]|nr:sugar transferase [Chloroflexi bacterium TSY]